MDEKSLKAILADTQGALVDLGEAINEQALMVSALLTALAETVPGFAPAFVEAHAAEVAAQEKNDNEGTPNVREMIERIQKLRRT